MPNIAKRQSTKPPSPTQRLTTKAYKALLSDLADILELGRQRAEQAVAQELAQTYWQLGGRLADANRATRTITALAEDLGLPPQTLYRATALYKRYPAGLPDLSLGWSHYRKLLAIPDARLANKYARSASKNGWSVRKLDEAIKAERFKQLTAAEKRSAKKLRRPRQPEYVYRAEYLRAVDADTVILRVDLGFYVRLEQRMRLAGLDAEEGGTKLGDRATAYVHKVLSTAGTLAVKSHRVDRYGRYVAHVFYAKAKELEGAQVFAKGKYLNAELVEKGLARKL